jgi:hypothetical protein
MEENYINVPLIEPEEKIKDYIELTISTPKRIQYIYELSKSIEDISTSSKEKS